MSEVDQSHHSPAPLRRASVLIIVVGLAALLLSLFLVIMRTLRSEAEDGIMIHRDAQARIMLPAALGFLLEAGRLGQHFDGEAFGWTDLRDGEPGPRPARSQGASSLPAMPSASGPLAGRHSLDGWPAPGSHYRADMYALQRPPQAVRSVAAPNPLQMPPGLVAAYEQAEDPSTTLLWKMLRPEKGSTAELGWVPASTDARDGYWTDGTGAVHPVLTDRGLIQHWGRVWDLVEEPMRNLEPGYHGRLGIQPVADSLDDFRRGDRRPVLTSRDQGWFRIYREQDTDHNGDGTPWFDTMALTGHAVFIVTCGGGASRGYRDWAEVVAYGDEAVFMNDPAYFAEIRAQERIHWYRVEWTGFVGGGGATHEGLELASLMDIRGDKEGMGPKWQWSNIHMQRNFPLSFDYKLKRDRPYIHSRSNAPVTLVNVCGTIKWIDKLESEPTDGPSPGQGAPLW